MRRIDSIAKLARTLSRRRVALLKTLAQHASMAAMKDRPVGDSIDAAVDCEQDELDSRLAGVESRELAAIDAALDSIQRGNYGACENCGKPIPTARLKAVPYATLCVKCQRNEERRSDEWREALHLNRLADEPFDEPFDEADDSRGVVLKTA